MISVNPKNKIGKRKTNPNKTTPKIVNPDNSKATEDQNSQKTMRKRNGIMVLVDIRRLVVTSMSSFWAGLRSRTSGNDSTMAFPARNASSVVLNRSRILCTCKFLSTPDNRNLFGSCQDSLLGRISRIPSSVVTTILSSAIESLAGIHSLPLSLALTVWRKVRDDRLVSALKLDSGGRPGRCTRNLISILNI